VSLKPKDPRAAAMQQFEREQQQQQQEMEVGQHARIKGREGYA